jgi:hypothetical protein
MTVLYHYTCEHGRAGIDGLLVPGPDGFIWLTDMAYPNRDALGLTMNYTRCDRTRYRYRVTDNSGAVPWTTVRRSARPAWREWIEEAPGVRPRHWWIAIDPVPVVLDPREAS